MVRTLIFCIFQVLGDYLYSASSDETARAWVTDIAQELQIYKRHEHTVFKVAVRNDLCKFKHIAQTIIYYDFQKLIMIEF